jgi:hypothetical protein
MFLCNFYFTNSIYVMFLFVSVSLQCKRDGMLVSGSAMKLFSGTLKAKHNREYYCERTITNAFTFETQIAYGDCGMQKQVR